LEEHWWPLSLFPFGEARVKTAGGNFCDVILLT
jgi:hypothetical protein